MPGLAMNTAGQGLTVAQKLAGGLRINGRALSETRAVGQASAVGKPENSQGLKIREIGKREADNSVRDIVPGAGQAKPNEPGDLRPGQRGLTGFA
jgi:hypothetical protein